MWIKIIEECSCEAKIKCIYIDFKGYNLPLGIEESGIHQ